MNKFKKNWLIGLLGVALVVFTIFSFNKVDSSALDNMAGFAWGGDWVDFDSNSIQDPVNEETGGLGWLSFNCTSPNECASSDYGVNIGSDGYLTGYAWSSNYGWLKFGGLSGFPTGGGTTADNAKLTGSNLTGWARFCSVAANPTSCSGATVPNLINGGWDGWLSLAGTGYGVSLSGNNLSGYAWGGNDNGKNVVGWVNFSTAFSNVTYIPVTGPVVTLTATYNSIPAGASTTLNWTGMNLLSSPTGCSATNGTGGWAGSRPSPTGSFNTGNLSAGTYTYTISCLGTDGLTWSPTSSVIITVGASQLDFYASPATAYPPNFTVTLNWNAVPSGTFDSCVADSAPPLNVTSISGWSGPVSNTPGSAVNIPVPYNPTNFKITCNNGGSPVSSTISVARGNLPEAVTLSSNGVVSNLTTLSWSTVNIVGGSCTASGGWSGSKATPSGSEPNVPVPNTAPAYTTYSLTCTGLYSGNPITVSILLNENSGPKSNKVQPKFKER